MKKMMIALLALGSFSSYATDFKVTLQTFGGTKIIQIITLPSDNEITVANEQASCVIDGTGYDPAASHGFIAISLSDDKGNSSFGGGLVANGNGVMAAGLNEHMCLLFEIKN